MPNTKEEDRPKPGYQHPLLQPDKRHTPPLPAPARRQTIPRKPVTPKDPATTFDEILLTVNTSNEPHGQQAASHITLPTTLHRSPTPPRQSKPPSRAARFFARFRSSTKDSESQQVRGRSQSRSLSQSQALLQSKPQRPHAQDQPPSQSSSSKQNPTLPRPSPAERRQQSREHRAPAKQTKADLKEAERQERARTQWLGGVAWGFDPEAGMRRTQDDDQQQQDEPHRRRRSDKDVRRAWCAPMPASPTSPRHGSSAGGSGSLEHGQRAHLASDDSSAAGPSTQAHPGNPKKDSSISSMSSTQSMGSGFEEVHLGVEAGGPGREGQFEYGMLRSRQVQRAKNGELSRREGKWKAADGAHGGR